MRPFIPTDNLPAYAKWEGWWLREARRICEGGSDTRALLRLRPAVARLSELYTKDRDSVSEAIYRDPALRAAYGLFFFPRTYARMRLVLQELRDRVHWHPKSQRLRLLDLGCGPGASTLAAIDHLREMAPLDVVAVDHSPDHLRTLDALAAEGGQDRHLRLHTRHADLVQFANHPSKDGARDLIVMGFSLGEAFRGAEFESVLAWVKNLISTLRSDGRLVIVEPALRETSERLEMLRDRLLAEGVAAVDAPCPHAAGCPLLAGGQYWCHEVRRWNPAPATEYLNRGLHRDIQLLKFSFLSLRRADGERAQVAPAFTKGRLLSPVAKVSGRLVFAVCGDDGRHHTVDAQQRDLDNEAKRALLAVERGDWMEFTGLETLPSGTHHRLVTGSSWKQLW